jgi:hypothetical protein
MHFYPEASSDGSVMLFGWDRSRPAPQMQNMVVQLGRAADKVVSSNFFLNIPEQMLQAPGIDLKIRYTRVNSNREALVLFNEANAVYLPANRGKGIEMQTVDIEKAWLRPGPNKVQILYEEAVKSDPDKGFTVYFMDLAPRM